MQGGICAIQEDILRGRNVEHEGRPFSSTENLEATMRKGAWFNLFCLGAAGLGREGGSLFYHHRSNAYLKAGYQATPFNISLNQCSGRSWPRPRRRICASGKYPGH